MPRMQMGVTTGRGSKSEPGPRQGVDDKSTITIGADLERKDDSGETRADKTRRRIPKH